MKVPLSVLVRSLFLAATLLATAASFAAQEPACGSCGDTGAVTCGNHKQRELGWENGLFCSELFACEDCAGTGREDCTDCEAESRLDARRARIAELAQGLAEIEQKMGRPVRVAESEHFVLVCELPKLKIGSSKRSPHELLHIYLDRLEVLFADYLEVFGVADDQFAEKSRVFLWAEPADHVKAGKAFCGYTNPTPVYQRGVVSTFSAVGGSRPLADDEALHRTVVHHLAHGIMNLQRPANWMATTKAGWADAGVAHWFEDRHFGTTTTFCYTGVADDAAYKSGRWRKSVRKLVSKGEAPPLKDLVQLDTQELDREQHALGFSLIDYLMERDARKLNELLQRLRARSPTRDAVKAAYGEDLETLEAGWKAWVLEAYPKR